MVAVSHRELGCRLRFVYPAVAMPTIGRKQNEWHALLMIRLDAAHSTSYRLSNREMRGTEKEERENERK